MNPTIISVDLAKNVFEVALANHQHRVVARKRLSRARFSRFLTQDEPATVLFESCGTAHFWARQAVDAGHRLVIIPAQYVKPYRRRNKSDRIDSEALLEAHRCQGIRPVPVRSVDQQQLQQLHRVREQWKKTRNARINALRGCLRELGHPIAEGASNAKRETRTLLVHGGLPPVLASTFSVLLQEAQDLEQRVGHNKATVALANKLARICWAAWKNNSDFNPQHLSA